MGAWLNLISLYQAISEDSLGHSGEKKPHIFCLRHQTYDDDGDNDEGNKDSKCKHNCYKWNKHNIYWKLTGKLRKPKSAGGRVFVKAKATEWKRVFQTRGILIVKHRAPDERAGLDWEL